MLPLPPTPAKPSRFAFLHSAPLDLVGPKGRDQSVSLSPPLRPLPSLGGTIADRIARNPEFAAKLYAERAACRKAHKKGGRR